MVDERFIFVAAFITLIGISLYALSTLRGQTKPNRVTWALWTAIPLITFFAQISEGVGLLSIFALAYAIGPLLVLAASFANKKAYWKLTTFDIICGVISVLAIALWLITGDGITAIVLSIVADFVAGLPTLVKGYKAPKTENVSAFVFGIISALIALATIHTWNVAYFLFPLYAVLDSLLLTLTIKVFSKYHKNPKRVKNRVSTTQHRSV